MKNKLAVVSIIALILLLPLTSQVKGTKTSTGYIIHNLGEGIVLATEYNISTNFADWRITDNKAVDMAVYVVEQPDNSSLFIEHMHADCFIESSWYYFDGILQDSMDDKIHGTIDQPGFYMTKDYPYYECFSIEGTSPTFVESLSVAWGYYCAAVIMSDSETFKYSEEDLRDQYAVYGSTLYIVYDVGIMYDNETYFHKQVFSDNIFIDLNGTITDNNENQYDIPATEPIPQYGWFCFLVALPVVVIVARRNSKK